MISDDVYLGDFKTGEIPLPLTVRFDDHDGVQLDIAGWSAAAYYRSRGAAGGVSLSATVDTSTNPLGVAVVIFTAAAVAAPGAYWLEVWVGNGGTNRLASRTYRYHVTERLPVAIPTV